VARQLQLAMVLLLASGGPIALGFGLAAAGAAGAAGAQPPPVAIVDFDYNPANLTIDLGTTVTWRNTGGRPHTVTDRGGTFDTDPIQPGATGTVTFSTPGTYHVFCRINPTRMNGVITVRQGAQPAPTIRVEAVDPALPDETLRFEPPTFSVPAGTTLLFANVGGRPHTLTADDGSFDSGVVTPGAEGGRFAGTNATLTLGRPGTFAFHCEVHPQAMRGTITVTGQAAARAGPSPPSNAPTTANVEVVDFAFQEAQISVAPDGEVTFRNTGDAPHTATLDDVMLDTGTIQPGASAKLTAPTKPGSYSYRCTIHPARMRGVLVVVGQNTEDPAAPAGGGGAAAPPVAVGGGGPSGGVSGLVLATGVIGGFLGGVGVAAFARPGRGSRKPAPATPAASADGGPQRSG
jgi:plastocyanin